MFLLLLLVLHVLEPEFDPSWRMISEYEIGRYGWMMSLAFFCWSGGLLALSVALSPWLSSSWGTIGTWWFRGLSLALIGAGIFKTNAILDSTPSRAHTLHALCGALVIITFPSAATLASRHLARSQEWAAERRLLTWGKRFVWFALVAFFGSMIISQVIHPGASRVGPDVLIGWPNRFLVAVYNLWIIVIAYRSGALRERRFPSTRRE